MHTFRTHSQLAVAAADMVRAYMLAMTRAASLSTSQSCMLWAHTMIAWNRACLPQKAMQAPEAPSAAEPSSSDAAFASYRSAGGHASAQVIVG
jgi:hypothetical protein